MTAAFPPDALRVLEAQLTRMRAMIYGYYELLAEAYAEERA